LFGTTTSYKLLFTTDIIFIITNDIRGCYLELQAARRKREIKRERKREREKEREREREKHDRLKFWNQRCLPPCPRARVLISIPAVPFLSVTDTWGGGWDSGGVPCRCMICLLIYGSNVSKNAGPIELH